jgi:hypothetical protein
MEYDADAGTTNVNLFVYRKTGGTGTYGDLLYSTAGVTFSTNPLQLQVTADSLSLVYNGSTLFTTNSHGLDLGEWTGGAVCAIEAEDRDNTEFVLLDNFKAWREDTTPATRYDGSFTNAPDGMMLRALMEETSVYRNWSVTYDTTTYVTNGRVILIPDGYDTGSSWMNARQDFQSDFRMIPDENVAEIRVGLREFTSGYAKIGLLPEYFPDVLYDHWNDVALYLEMYRSGGNIVFIAYRTHGIEGARTALAGSCSVVYDNISDITVQVSSDTFKAYYGTTEVVNAGHGLADFSATYPAGIYPHVEYQSGVANGCTVLDGFTCRMLESFDPPE